MIEPNAALEGNREQGDVIEPGNREQEDVIEPNAALGGDAQPVNRYWTVIRRTVNWIIGALFVAGLGHFLEWYTGWHLLTNYTNTGVWTQELQVQILRTIFGTLLAIMFTQRPRTLFICMLCIFAFLRLVEWCGVKERQVGSSKRDRF